MLHAVKRVIETELKVSVLQIRQRELDFYVQNCLLVNMQATLLFGFSYAGFISVPPDAHSKLKLAYILVTTAAMSCEVNAVVNTTLLSVLGPGLALRGKDGSMHQAIESMMRGYRRAFISCALGLIGCQVSALLWGWMVFSKREKLPSNDAGARGALRGR